MKKIYILLAQSDTLISEVIRFVTRAPYNHAAIGVDDTLTYFWTFGRKLRFFPVIGGFIRERINQGMYRHHPKTRCMISALEVSDEEYEEVRATIRHYVKHRREYGYNHAALFGGIIHRPFFQPKRHTCSEFVATVIQNCGIHRFARPLPLTRPDELMGIPGLEPIFEGLMMEFQPYGAQGNSFPAARA
jgi:hypothetical protein